MQIDCKICGHPSNLIFRKSVLNKYNSGYYQCSNCEFIQTDRPYWLDEAYSSAISSIDIGLLYRNFHTAPLAAALITKFFNPAGAFLDYGGGYGIFTRLMRDKGFNFYRQDVFCENLFAKHFDLKDVPAHLTFEMLTTFEVFEHLEHPAKELEGMIALSENIFFSTELIPRLQTTIEKWWYIMPETGQHISFYSVKTLQWLAQKNNLYFYTNGTNLHLFTKKKINSFFFRLLNRSKVAKLYLYIKGRNKTLLMKDYKFVKQLINTY